MKNRLKAIIGENNNISGCALEEEISSFVRVSLLYLCT